MDRARAAFLSRGLRLTDLRLAVFGEIASSHHAVGAYDIIDRLGHKGIRLAPVSVYRAIEALTEAGVVHRLESRNAYFACHADHTGESRHVIMTCRACGTIAEYAAAPVFDAIDALVARQSFLADNSIVEVAGHCARCVPVRP